MAQSKDKVPVYSYVRPEVRRQLAEIANKSGGLSITDVIEKACEGLIVKSVEDGLLYSPEARVEVAFQKMENEKRVLLQLKQMAIKLKNDRTDDGLQELTELAVENGYTGEDVVSWLENTVDITEFADPSQTLRPADLFLIEVFKKQNPGKLIPVKTVKELAEQEGLKWSMVEKAKLSNGIDSKRTGSYGSWYYDPDKATNGKA